jgi:hypothetical protein
VRAIYQTFSPFFSNRTPNFNPGATHMGLVVDSVVCTGHVVHRLYFALGMFLNFSALGILFRLFAPGMFFDFMHLACSSSIVCTGHVLLRFLHILHRYFCTGHVLFRFLHIVHDIFALDIFYFCIFCIDIFALDMFYFCIFCIDIFAPDIFFDLFDRFVSSTAP